MADVLQGFPDREAMKDWRNAHRTVDKATGRCVAYTGYLVNTQALNDTKKMLHTACCDNSAPNVGKETTSWLHWMGFETKDHTPANVMALVDRADPSNDNEWQDCGTCGKNMGSQESRG